MRSIATGSRIYSAVILRGIQKIRGQYGEGRAIGNCARAGNLGEAGRPDGDICRSPLSRLSRNKDAGRSGDARAAIPSRRGRTRRRSPDRKTIGAAPVSRLPIPTAIKHPVDGGAAGTAAGEGHPRRYLRAAARPLSLRC